METKEMTEVVAKLKAAYREFYGEPMSIWEETLIDALPKELDFFLSNIVDCVEKISELFTLYRQRMNPEIPLDDVRDLKDWLDAQGWQHSNRLWSLVSFVNVVGVALKTMRRDLLP